MTLLSVRERCKTKTNSLAGLFKRVHFGSDGALYGNAHRIIEFPWYEPNVYDRQSLPAMQLKSTRLGTSPLLVDLLLFDFIGVTERLESWIILFQPRCVRISILDVLLPLRTCTVSMKHLLKFF